MTAKRFGPDVGMRPIGSEVAASVNDFEAEFVAVDVELTEVEGLTMDQFGIGIRALIESGAELLASSSSSRSTTSMALSFLQSLLLLLFVLTRLRNEVVEASALYPPV